MMTEASEHPLLSRQCWCIMGLPFDAVSEPQSAELIASNIVTNKACFLSTPNLNFVVSAQTDDDFYQSVVDSDLSIADGMPLIWVAKLLGLPITERVAGSSLFEFLSHNKINQQKIKVFFFGGQQGVAEQASLKLNQCSTAMESCGFFDPGFISVDEMSDQAIIDKVNEANSDFIVVALGAKKGQNWIQKNRHMLNAPVISHLGAVINFVAGNIDRAPQNWQQLGLEWLWRIKQEPNLWRRYFFDGLAFSKMLLTKIIPLAVYNRFQQQKTSFKVTCDAAIEEVKDSCVLHLSGSVHNDTLELVKLKSLTILQDYNNDVVVDFEKVTYVDSAFIAYLLIFQSYLNQQDRKLSIRCLSSQVKAIMNLNSVLQRFTIFSLNKSVN